MTQSSPSSWADASAPHVTLGTEGTRVWRTRTELPPQFPPPALSPQKETYVHIPQLRILMNSCFPAPEDDYSLPRQPCVACTPSRPSCSRRAFLAALRGTAPAQEREVRISSPRLPLPALREPNGW